MSILLHGALGMILQGANRAEYSTNFAQPLRTQGLKCMQYLVWAGPRIITNSDNISLSPLKMISDMFLSKI